MADPYYALITPLEKEFSPVRPGQPGVPHPSNPIAGVGTPENPIVIPPNAVGPGSPDKPIWLPAYPDNALPGTPEGPPMPTNPIVFPPGLSPFPPTDKLPPLVPAHPIVVPPNGTLPAPPAGAEKGADAVVVLLPPSKLEPPAGTPAGYQAAILWYGPNTLPVQVWVPPETAHKHAPKKGKGTEERDEREAEARYRAGSK